MSRGPGHVQGLSRTGPEGQVLSAKLV